MPTFDIKLHAEFGKYIGTKLDGAIRRGLLSTAMRVVNHIKTEVIPSEPREPVLRGVYAAGWKAQKTDGGADVYNDVPYATIIEKGVPASSVKIGRKMIDALTEWVRMKGLVAAKRPVAAGGSQFVTRIRYVKKTSDEVNDDARAVAWAIAQSMKKRGIFNGGKGLRILERALLEVPRFVVEEVTREIQRLGGG
jgi:hypothetical protein